MHGLSSRLVLSLVAKGFQSFGLGVVPRHASRAYQPIGRRFFGYQQGASLRLSRYPHRDVVADFRDLRQKIEKAKVLVKPPHFKPGDEEPLGVFDVAGNRVTALPRWQIHKLGIRHETSNVILVTPDNRVVLQKRSENKDLFPGRYTISAGGHMTLDEEGSPIQTARRELKEELNLNIDESRFIPLGNGERGIPNFVKVWTWAETDSKAVITQFDEEAEDISIEIKATPPRKAGINLERAVSSLIRRIQKEARISSKLMLGTFNVELCHYYLVRITDEEQRQITFTDGEAEEVKVMDLDDVIRTGKKLDTATDSLYCLFGKKADPEIGCAFRKFVTPKNRFMIGL